jgi:DNA (cytosine-5)-methyltransferase 1
MIVDLYAGAGGWSEGMRAAGLGPTIGVEWWHPACQTAVAAGHLRVRADVATYPTWPFAGRTVGVVASPPCQPWSRAGQRLGEQDRTAVYELVNAYAAGSQRAWLDMAWADDRSHHAAQPVRWLHALRPEWVALEQVPGILPLWKHIGRVLIGWGYHVWTGILCAADYGVPQTRHRAVLIASRARRVGRPPATHYDARRGVGLFGEPWVTMAEALDWYGTLTTDQVSNRGKGPEGPYRRDTERPAPTLTGSASQWTFRNGNGNRKRAAVRYLDQPAPTIHFGNNHKKVEWVATRPATTVLGDQRIAAPGRHGDRVERHADSIKVGIVEAAILQGFRPDYPWSGCKTAQYTQVGNAIPPLLAETIARTAAGRR